MKLFLTRLGIESKMVVNGDVTQTDLPKNVTSGLIHAATLLTDIDDIGIHHFDRFDVIRHPLIQTILERYDA
jgi:phosphate starvation-inducible PhoH-like protein